MPNLFWRRKEVKLGNPFRPLPVKNAPGTFIAYGIFDDTLDVYACGRTTEPKYYLYSIYPMGTVGEVTIDDLVFEALQERVIVVPGVNY